MKIYNSLTRSLEEFTPINPPHVGIYTCGPTIYDRKHIGNFRTYTLSDLLVRILTFDGFDVTHIMNFTDVGHLTGDNEGDADQGEDRMEKAAKRDRKTAWEIAATFEKVFIDDFDKLNLIRPQHFLRATDHIPEQIELIKRLEEHGLTYKISDGIYFDTVSYESNTGRVYGELSDIDSLSAASRIEPNPEKKNPRDFALWKFSPQGVKRDMEWESPWGVGFPGWHVECSAMSMKYLGETFDLHVGGNDLRSTHHPNEIAQSEGATGKTFVNYWVHGAFILIDGERMATSKNNNYNLGDIEAKGYDPLALRYLYFGTHYKKVMNFTWDALDAASTALNKLRAAYAALETREDEARTELSNEKLQKINKFLEDFKIAVNDDLNMARALAVTWEVVKSNIPTPDKKDLLTSFDEVFGFHLNETIPVRSQEEPENIRKLKEMREALRREKKFEEADEVRRQIEELGYTVSDAALKN